jgi:hypothetical protein
MGDIVAAAVARIGANAPQQTVILSAAKNPVGFPLRFTTSELLLGFSLRSE